MANIDKELKAIEEAIYGEDVRKAIHDGIKAVNDSATDSAHVAETKASQASADASQAQASAENAEYWARQAEEVVKLEWGGIEAKPFETLNSDQFESVNGALTSKLKAKDIMTDTNASIQKELDELKSFESITYKGTVETVDDLPTDAENGWMYYCQEDRKHYVCVNDPEIDLYEWHEYHTFDDDYLITVEKVKNDLETQEEGFVLDARQGYELKQDLTHFVGGDAWVQKTYNEGDVCIHNNIAWVCLATTTVEPSASATSYWKTISLKTLSNGLNDLIKIKRVTGTTTSSGALLSGLAGKGIITTKLISTSGTGARIFFARNDGYLVCYIPASTGITPATNENIVCDVYYMD